MRVAFACVKKTCLHASSLQQTRIHALCMQVRNAFFHTYVRTYVRSCWLKFSSIALQFYSEHRRFVCGPTWSPQSPHTLHPELHPTSCSHFLCSKAHAPNSHLKNLNFLAAMAVTRVDLVCIALNNIKRPCPWYHLHQGFPSSFLSQVVVPIESSLFSSGPALKSAIHVS